MTDDRGERATGKDIVLVTEYFHPSTASTGQLMTDLAVGLVDRGLDLQVYTGQPNYHSGDNERQPHHSTHEGVPVTRIRAPQVRQSSLPRRLFNWVVFTGWMVVALAMDRQDDRELLFTSNPPFLPIAMWLLCRLKGWEYTYIVYDLYPDVIVESGYLNPEKPYLAVVYRAWKWIHRYVFHDAARVVALGPVMRNRIAKEADPRFDASKVEIIHNWADGEFIEPVPKQENPFSQEHDLVEPFTLVYSGNIGANHDLETVIRAADRLRDEPVKFFIIGEGDNKSNITDLAASLDLDSDTVEFLPYQDLDVLPYSLTAGDASIVTVSEGMKGLCVSSKLYTSLATDQPALVISEPNDDEARIVESHNAGEHVTQGNVDRLVAVVRKWKSSPETVERQGHNAREAFEASFTKEHCIDEYYRLLSADGTVEKTDQAASLDTEQSVVTGDGTKRSTDLT
jgi:glycosyltransferase involved in cell wall biosynthesis